MRPRSSIGPIVLLLTTLAPAPGVAEAGTFEQVAKLTGADTAGGDFFGFDVAIDGDRLAVGALWDDDLGPQSGSAYVFERDPAGSGEWRESAKLLAPDGVAGDLFGGTVALNGATAVVGAVVDDPLDLGYAHVFERDADGAWKPVAKLQATDGVPDDSFGAPVAISGDTVAVGAIEAAGPGGDGDGAVYVFERDAGGPGNWGQTAKLTAPKACDFGNPNDESAACGWVFDDAFGASVVVNGDVLAVGGGGIPGVGYVYLFRRVSDGSGSRWQRLTRVQPVEGQNLDGIGNATAIDGGTLLLGADGDDDFDGQSGATYVYEADPGSPTGVSRTAKLYAPEPGEGDTFGNAVALSGETAIVGAPEWDGGGRGYAYIFRREDGATRGWVAVTKLEPRQLAGGDRFGDSVAISRATAVVAARGDDDRGTDAGAVYVFQETTAEPERLP